MADFRFRLPSQLFQQGIDARRQWEQQSFRVPLHGPHQHGQHPPRGMWSQQEDSFGAGPRPMPQTAPVNPQAAQLALNRANAVLQGGATDLGAVQGGTSGVIIADAPDTNGAADTDPTSQRYQLAAATVRQNAPTVNAALSSLGPSSRAQYSALNQQLSGDPVAQLAAQSLLLSGKLGQTDTQGTTLLSSLSSVAQGRSQLAPGVDPKTFVSQLTKEVATPGAINQQDTYDCAPTQASILLDRVDGPEYARLALQAASPSGTVTWADGSQDTRVGPVPQGTGQSLPQQMLSAIAMQAGGGQADGMTSSNLGVLMGKMFNRPIASQDVDTTSTQSIATSQADMMSKLYSASSHGSPASAAIELTDAQGNPLGAHEVLVNSVTSDGHGGGTVQYTNPWGDEEVTSIAAFQSRLTSVNYDPTSISYSRSQLYSQQRQYALV